MTPVAFLMTDRTYHGIPPSLIQDVCLPSYRVVSLGLRREKVVTEPFSWIIGTRRYKVAIAVRIEGYGGVQIC
jgi:hypothetical protein